MHGLVYKDLGRTLRNFIARKINEWQLKTAWIKLNEIEIAN